MVENANDGNSGAVIDLDNDPDIIRGKPEPKDFEFGNALDPAASVGTSSGGNSVDSGTPKRRGRKPGSKNAPKNAKVDLEGLASVVFGIHTALASLAHVPELELDEKEAEKLTQSSVNVLRHYMDTVVSQKNIDWINLFSALSAIYGPRVIAVGIRRKKERSERRQQVFQQPQQTTDLRGTQNVKPENVIIMPGAFADPPDRGTVG